MFPIDFPTVFFSYLITNIVSLTVIVILFLQVKKRFSGCFHILLSFVFNSAGTGLVFMRNTIPDWISMSVANALIFSAAVMMLIGLEQFFNKRTSHTHNYILIFVYFCIHLYFTLFNPVLFARLLISSFVLLYIFTLTAWFMFVKTPNNMRRIVRGVGFTFCAYSLIYSWRIFFLLKENQIADAYFYSSGSEIWFIISNQIVFLFLAYNISLMYNKRLLIEVTTQEEKFKELIKNSFDMIALIDRNGVLNYASESCEKILGFKPQELMNVSIIEQMIHPEDQGLAKKKLQGIFENSNQDGIQCRHRHKNGSWVYLEAFGNNQTQNPVVQAVILNIRDISDRKQKEDELQESEKQLRELNATKDKFFSIIAHDLKSPFNSIVGFSNVLVDRVKQKDYKQIENFAGYIQESSNRALDLLLNLLEWANSQTGQMNFVPVEIDMVALVNETTELLSDSARQKSISVSCELPERANVFADKSMINAILRNLIANAVKFTNFGGAIRISVKQKQTELLVAVEDSGIGIAESDIKKLFRIEETYSKTGTNKETGTGLGLILCKDFIEKHQGKIWVESEVGKGTIFYFTIPTSKDD